MTNSMALMLQSFSGLSSLRRLIPRDCNLGEGDIPIDIGCLSSLEILDLSGNHFISIPSSLTRLSKLYSVDLSHCKKLKSFPELLTTVARLNTNGCTTLELIANPSKACNNFTESASFSGVNCYKLVEKMNAVTLLKRHLKVFANSRKQFDIIMPGSEVPEWFSSHERVESSSITILPLITRNDSQWMGVAFFCIFVNSEDQSLMYEVLDFEAFACYRNSESYDTKFIDVIGSHVIGRIEKDHIFLRYLSSDKLANCFNQEWDEFGLTFRPISSAYNVKVKQCGVRMVYQEDLEDVQLIEEHQFKNQDSPEFEDNNEDGSTANGSLLKRKRNVFEDDTEAEPQPKRPKYDFNFIMG